MAGWSQDLLRFVEISFEYGSVIFFGGAGIVVYKMFVLTSLARELISDDRTRGNNNNNNKNSGVNNGNGANKVEDDH